MILAPSNDERLLMDDHASETEWRNAIFLIRAASDQYAAVAIELEGLCSGSRVEFREEQLWNLLRDVNVQNRFDQHSFNC